MRYACRAAIAIAFLLFLVTSAVGSPAELVAQLEERAHLISVKGKRVRERPGIAGLPLPFVAMGSIPHIYRREDLSPGDPNSSCPVTGNHTACLAMSVAVGTKFLQG